MLTQEELDAGDLLTDAQYAFEALPEIHPKDEKDADLHFRALHNIIMSRAAIRAHPDEFKHLAGSLE